MAQKRELVNILKQRGLKLTVAIEIAEIKKSTYYYHSGIKDNDIMERIREIAYKYPFYGYRRVWAYLRTKDGLKINHKKVYRLYCLMDLQKEKIRKKRVKDNKDNINLTEAEYPNHIWGMDFCFTFLENGRMVKIFVLEDIFSRKVLIIIYGYSIRGKDVKKTIEKAIKEYGRPKIIRSDNGPEFISKILKKFFLRERIQHEFIPKGAPWDNGRAERFIGSLKDECLNMMDEAELEKIGKIMTKYMEFYNKERPHQALKYKTPDEIYYKTKEKD